MQGCGSMYIVFGALAASSAIRVKLTSPGTKQNGRVTPPTQSPDTVKEAAPIFHASKLRPRTSPLDCLHEGVVSIVSLPRPRFTLSPLQARRAMNCSKPMPRISKDRPMDALVLRDDDIQNVLNSNELFDVRIRKRKFKPGTKLTVQDVVCTPPTFLPSHRSTKYSRGKASHATSGSSCVIRWDLVTRGRQECPDKDTQLSLDVFRRRYHRRDAQLLSERNSGGDQQQKSSALMAKEIGENGKATVGEAGVPREKPPRQTEFSLEIEPGSLCSVLTIGHPRIIIIGCSRKEPQKDTGAPVAALIALSPPTKANRAQSPAGSPDFRKWESCRTIPLIDGSSRGSPVSPTPSFRRRSIFTSNTLIGSRDLAVKNRPNIFTHSNWSSDGRIVEESASLPTRLLSPRSPVIQAQPGRQISLSTKPEMGTARESHTRNIQRRHWRQRALAEAAGLHMTSLSRN
ncbi:hypothetical protein PR048_023208 [Dryococelus australis]|uniref:Uncharacterized protein n=1 Tax=Dryococelus australis TaxID=614101 RepID=A0ABQ9GTI3_9NEOP|nr:hypothetical protein PR048_023208 [Dryococelus australis]